VVIPGDFQETGVAEFLRIIIFIKIENTWFHNLPPVLSFLSIVYSMRQGKRTARICRLREQEPEQARQKDQEKS
jgi:hypothetical protein